MAFRILLVEDDAEIAEYVAQGLREEGFLVEWAADGHDGAHALATSTWDLVILDWWLPGPDGQTLLRDFRNAGKTTPVLFLTARDAVQQRVEGLNGGADDYLCKPFAFEELHARVQALLRRLPGLVGTEWRYRDVVLDPSTNRAEAPGGRSASLPASTPCSCSSSGTLARCCLCTRLYEQVWQERYDGLSNTLEVHVMELRKKLEAHGPRLIHTVRGRGYMLGEPSQAEGQP